MKNKNEVQRLVQKAIQRVKDKNEVQELISGKGMTGKLRSKVNTLAKQRALERTKAMNETEHLFNHRKNKHKNKNPQIFRTYYQFFL